jgi:hypothetical protein
MLIPIDDSYIRNEQKIQQKSRLSIFKASYLSEI